MIAEDSLLLREGIAGLLTASHHTVTGKAADGETLLELVAADPPDLCVLDMRMPPTFTTEGFDVAERLAKEHPGVAVMFLSHYVEASQAIRLLALRGRTRRSRPTSGGSSPSWRCHRRPTIIAECWPC